jgi:hypothetical protein
MITPDSFIMTPNGACQIENLSIGDEVYICNNGKITISNIKNKETYISKIYKIMYYNQCVAKVSNVTFFTSDERRKHLCKEKLLNNISKHDVLYRKFVSAPLGNKNEVHAYSLGALLGDGCKYSGNSIHISADNKNIPEFVAQQLNAKFIRKNKNNYTYIISNGMGNAGNRGHDRVMCHYYDLWCKNRLAHEKIIDLNEVIKWNRQSSIALVAGLLDTDGSLEYDNGRLTVSWFSQSISIINGLQHIILSLWQVKPKVCVDNRNKYVNGPVYKLYVKKNMFSKKIFNDCSPFLKKRNINTFNIKHKAKYCFIQPNFSFLGMGDVVSLGFNGYLITANQGLLLK